MAVGRLEEGAGSQWDPSLVGLFLAEVHKRVEGHAAGGPELGEEARP